MSEFESAVQEAVEYAKNEADAVTGGDPGTMVSAEVNGNKSFARNFKDHGTDTGSAWTIDGATVSDDYSFHLDVLEGTDIQSHKKKIRAIRAFKEKMQELGYDCDVEVNTYSY